MLDQPAVLTPAEVKRILDTIFGPAPKPTHGTPAHMPKHIPDWMRPKPCYTTSTPTA